MKNACKWSSFFKWSTDYIKESLVFATLYYQQCFRHTLQKQKQKRCRLEFNLKHSKRSSWVKLKLKIEIEKEMANGWQNDGSQPLVIGQIKRSHGISFKLGCSLRRKWEERRWPLMDWQDGLPLRRTHSLSLSVIVPTVIERKRQGLGQGVALKALTLHLDAYTHICLHFAFASLHSLTFAHLLVRQMLTILMRFGEWQLKVGNR